MLAALRIALLVIDGVALADVTSARERLEAQGADVVIVVPTGGANFPVSGQYYAGAGGHGARAALSQVTAREFDFLLLPDGITAAQLEHFPLVLAFIRGEQGNATAHPLPVLTMRFLTAMRGHALTGC